MDVPGPPDLAGAEVTLAPSGGEGGNSMGAMRWAQTANYGVAPNPAMPKTRLGGWVVGVLSQRCVPRRDVAWWTPVVGWTPSQAARLPNGGCVG